MSDGLSFPGLDEVGMKLTATLDLDAALADGEWRTTLGHEIREEILKVLRSQVRQSLVEDKQFQRVVANLKVSAIAELLESTK